MAVRTTQLGVEILANVPSSVRVSQLGVEVLYLPGPNPGFPFPMPNSRMLTAPVRRIVAPALQTKPKRTAS